MSTPRAHATLRQRSVLVVALFGVFVACGGQELPPKPPAPPPAVVDPPQLATIAKSCARISSCVRAHDAVKFRDPGACVDWWLDTTDTKTPDALRKCLAEAGNCQQVTACMQGGADSRTAAFCGQKAGVVSGCDGDRLVSCGDEEGHEGSVVDCAAIGANCKELKAASGIILRGCVAPQKCPAGGPDMRCDGPSAIISCRDGAYERIVCRPGTTCEERRDDSGEASASCELPNRRRCDLRGARHCEADRLIECDRPGQRGKAHVTDCVGFGLRCTGSGPRAGCRVPTNAECDREMLPKCDGNAVVFCAAGRITKVACDKIGLGACDPAGKGPIAACAPGKM